MWQSMASAIMAKAVASEKQWQYGVMAMAANMVRHQWQRGVANNGVIENMSAWRNMWRESNVK